MGEVAALVIERSRRPCCVLNIDPQPLAIPAAKVDRMYLPDGDFPGPPDGSVVPSSAGLAVHDPGRRRRHVPEDARHDGSRALPRHRRDGRDDDGLGLWQRGYIENAPDDDGAASTIDTPDSSTAA